LLLGCQHTVTYSLLASIEVKVTCIMLLCSGYSAVLTNIILKKFSFFLFRIGLASQFMCMSKKELLFKQVQNLLLELKLQLVSFLPEYKKNFFFLQIYHLKNWGSHHNCAQSYYVLFRHFCARGKW
jgi:hypothetical protein